METMADRRIHNFNAANTPFTMQNSNLVMGITETNAIDLTEDDVQLPESTDAYVANAAQECSPPDIQRLEPIGANLTADVVDMTFTDSEGEGDENGQNQPHLPQHAGTLWESVELEHHPNSASKKNSAMKEVESKSAGPAKATEKNNKQGKRKEVRKKSDNEGEASLPCVSRSKASDRRRKRKKCFSFLKNDNIDLFAASAAKSVKQKVDRKGQNSGESNRERRRKEKQSDGKQAEPCTPAPSGVSAEAMKNGKRKLTTQGSNNGKRKRRKKRGRKEKQSAGKSAEACTPAPSGETANGDRHSDRQKKLSTVSLAKSSVGMDEHHPNERNDVVNNSAGFEDSRTQLSHRDAIGGIESAEAMNNGKRKLTTQGSNNGKKKGRKKRRGKEKQAAGKSAEACIPAPSGESANGDRHSDRRKKRSNGSPAKSSINTDKHYPSGRNDVVNNSTGFEEPRTQCPRRDAMGGIETHIDRRNDFDIWRRDDNDWSRLSSDPRQRPHLQGPTSAQEIVHVDALPMDFDEYRLSNVFRGHRGFLNAYVARDRNGLIGFIKFDCDSSALAAMEYAHRQGFWWAHHMILSGFGSLGDHAGQGRLSHSSQYSHGRERFARDAGRRPRNEADRIHISPEMQRMQCAGRLDEFGREIKAKQSIRPRYEVNSLHASSLSQRPCERQEKPRMEKDDFVYEQGQQIVTGKRSFAAKPTHSRSIHMQATSGRRTDQAAEVGKSREDSQKDNLKTKAVTTNIKPRQIHEESVVTKDNFTAGTGDRPRQAPTKKLTERRPVSKEANDHIRTARGRQLQQAHGRDALAQLTDTTLANKKEAAIDNCSLKDKRILELGGEALANEETKPELVASEKKILETDVAGVDKEANGTRNPQFNGYSKGSTCVVGNAVGNRKKDAENGPSSGVAQERRNASVALDCGVSEPHISPRCGTIYVKFGETAQENSCGMRGVQESPNDAERELNVGRECVAGRPPSGTGDWESNKHALDSDSTAPGHPPPPCNADEKPEGAQRSGSGKAANVDFQTKISCENKSTTAATDGPKGEVNHSERPALSYEKLPVTIVIDSSDDESNDYLEHSETRVTEVQHKEASKCEPLPRPCSSAQSAETSETGIINNTKSEAHASYSTADNEVIYLRKDCSNSSSHPSIVDNFVSGNSTARNTSQPHNHGMNCAEESKRCEYEGTSAKVDNNKESPDQNERSGFSQEKVPDPIEIDSSDDEMSATTSEPKQPIQSKPLSSFCSEPKRKFKPRVPIRRKRSNSSGQIPPKKVSTSSAPTKEPVAAKSKAPEVNFVFSHYKFRPEIDYDYKFSQSAALKEQERLFREARARVRAQTEIHRRPMSFTSPVENISKLSSSYPNHWKWRDPYARLGLPPGCPITIVKKQYRRLALVYHPDKSKLVDAPTRFQAITEAYKQLTRT